MQQSEHPYGPLPQSVPHPFVCRALARRGFVVFFTALLSAAVVLGMATASRASPCPVASVEAAAVARVLARLAAPAAAPERSGWHRLGALLPRRVAWTSRKANSDGAGWYAGLAGGVSERGLWNASDGWSVRLVWDLRPLWQPRPTAPAQRWRDPLQRAEQLEGLAGRLAHRLERLARLAHQAAAPELEPGRCPLLQAQAQAQVLAVRAAITAFGGAGRIKADLAAPRRRPSERLARPVAGLRPPGRGPPPSPSPRRARSARSGDP